MKKTIFHSMIVVATISIFTACNKEVERPVSNSVYSTTPAAHVVTPSAIIKKPIGYIGQSTLGDSTKVATNP